MPLYTVQTVVREEHKAPPGKSPSPNDIVSVSVSFTTTFPPIEAATPEIAFKKAVELYPNFRFRIAIGDVVKPFPKKA